MIGGERRKKKKKGDIKHLALLLSPELWGQDAGQDRSHGSHPAGELRGSVSVCPACIFCAQAPVSVGRRLHLCVLLTLVRAPGEAALRKEV